jgi:DNA ligase D-like protein (predicted 3'-phosphoesterase)
MGLQTYHEKRRFGHTPEPKGKIEASPGGNLFVIHKHAARHLHYDLRLELDGVLKSWAVPKGPSLNPAERRLAVHVEDHPVEYGFFEGTIPEGEYGAGTVMLWDRGTWEPQGDPREGYAKGDFKFKLHGEKLKGNWVLARMKAKPAGEEGKNWLLIKKRDDAAITESGLEPVEVMDRSVSSGRTMQEIELGRVESVGINPAALPGASAADLPDSIDLHPAAQAGKPPQGQTGSTKSNTTATASFTGSPVGGRDFSQGTERNGRTGFPKLPLRRLGFLWKTRCWTEKSLSLISTAGRLPGASEYSPGAKDRQAYLLCFRYSLLLRLRRYPNSSYNAQGAFAEKAFVL